MKLTLNIIPEEIIQKYNLGKLAHKGFVYMEIQKGVYGLPHAGKISNDDLRCIQPSLDTSQHPSPQVHGGTKLPPLQFSLVVDYYGIKYEIQEDITHLPNEFKTIYNISEDWDGKLYCGHKL